MSRIAPLPFQARHIAALVARFQAAKVVYDALGPQPAPATLTKARQNSACVMFQAPTGIGKTLMACELLSRFSAGERVLWFWFAPFTGVLSQARTALKRQAPNLGLLDIETDRSPEKLGDGSVFVLSWQTVAARSAESRLARQDSDAGWAIDALIAEARKEGLRIGVVVDEAHHGFVRATEAGKFFSEVLAPDYVLLMSATPRDTDAERFSKQTGYVLGDPSTWASIARREGVEAQLLKHSVKAARFIAHNNDDAQLVAYEELALQQCTEMHRHIKQTLKNQGIRLTPLMLVQVPNGGQAIKDAVAYLVEVLKFSPDAVRVHTAVEPTPDLDTMASDPKVEVILFKMAIATGFDAPRAFTLAALRGTRDVEFGIQVVGRIMRVERRLQGRLETLPPELKYGYVYLANSDVQEGLIGAASRINTLPNQLAQASTSALVTITAGNPSIQVIRPGDNLELVPDDISPGKENPSEPKPPPTLIDGPGPLPPQSSSLAQTSLPLTDNVQVTTRPELIPPGSPPKLLELFNLTAQKQAPLHQYAKRANSPDTLITEAMPPIPEDFEEQLVSCINFAKVLGDRTKVRTRVTQQDNDIFDKNSEVVNSDVWARLSVEAIAEKARQQAFTFSDIDNRELLMLLKKRFKAALIEEGHEPPKDPEELTQQLELILVRNPNLLKDAHKRVRAAATQGLTVHLPQVYTSEEPLAKAARNLYGVFPEGLNNMERAFADLLDIAPDVVWWHRNPVRKTYSVALYQWAGGTGFFPDFVIEVKDRKEGDGIALCELKGAHLLDYERKKSAAKHIKYGRVFMVGKSDNNGTFKFWRLNDEGLLVDDGRFEVQRMRYSV